MASARVAVKLIRHVGQQAGIAAGAATAGLRMQPDFMMIGGQRCGTTSLFRALAAHPQVIRPLWHKKGINYFDLNYYRGMSWYRGHFPVSALARRRGAAPGTSVFEASGYYLYHPFALERAARDLPGVKLVVMLRDPVERAFSAYKHEFARGFERESFEDALRLEDSRLDGEIDRMRADLRYESHAHRHHSYRRRGHYAEQLERAFRYFPRERVFVMESEEFFAAPAEKYRQLLDFLGLPPFEPARFDRHNGRPGEPMPAPTRRMLEDHYRPYDERLTALLGRAPGWARAVR